MCGRSMLFADGQVAAGQVASRGWLLGGGR